VNCESVLERLDALSGDALASVERRKIEEHIATCDECQSAIRGAEAMRTVKAQPIEHAPDELFERVMNSTTETAIPAPSNNGFWLGAGFGGALVAAIAIVALTLGLFRDESGSDADVAQFMVSMEETRDLNVAIDLANDLPGATLSVFISGGIELAGFGDRRELVWTADLDKGVNKLTLPVFATGSGGGQLIVKLDHAASHQVFVVNLKLDS
jgi:anti-sigma factor RsiW